MNQGFWELVWSHFLRVQTAVGGLLAVGLAFIGYIVAPESTVPTWTVILGAVLVGLVVLTYHETAYAAYQDRRTVMQAHEAEKEQLARQQVPKVVSGGKSPQSAKEVHLTCMLEPSHLFSTGTFVTFYHVEGGHEREIGVGAVLNVQTNGLILAGMYFPVPGYEEIIEQIRNNNPNTLATTMVKPTVPWRRVSFEEWA